MTRVVHLLPHPGGGAETYLDLLERMPEHVHVRRAWSAGRSPATAVRSIPVRWPGIAAEARRAGVVHAHGDVAAVLALPLLQARPSVWTTHGLHMLRRGTGPAGAAVRSGLRAVVRACEVTLCCSGAERDELAALVPGRWHERLHVVPNGVDLPAPDPGARAAARSELGAEPHMTAALFLGQLEERKDPLTAALAARRAAAEGADVVLWVAGDGPLAARVAELAGDAVRVLGFRDDPARLLAAADVFVLPSRREGISFAVLEAMAQGLAMVVADEPGNAEAVGDAGLILPPGDVEAFGRALGRLAADPVERGRLGEAARERVSRRFTVDQLIAGVGTAYAAARAAV